MAAIPPGTDLSKVPLQANPSGAPPNFVNPPTLIAGVRGVGITLGIISLILVATRLTIYIRSHRAIGLDDVAVVLAFVLAMGYTGMVCSAEQVTRHAWDTPLSIIDVDYMKKLLATSVFYGPMLFFAKASILLLYLRIFQPKRWLKWSVCISLLILFGAYWMTVPLGLVYCMPHNGAPWDFSVIENCGHLKIPGLIQGAINIAADITIFVLPLPIVFALKMPLAKKCAVTAVFMTGFFALLSSILTMYYRVRIIRGYDATWATAQTYICIEAEINAAIWVACMPSLAKIWNSNYKESKLYASMVSLLRSRSRDEKSAPTSEHSYESTDHMPTGLWRGDQRLSEADTIHSHQSQDRGRSIYKTTTFGVSSVEKEKVPV